MSNTLQTELLIIGGGPGGYIAGIRAGQLGVKTIVVGASIRVAPASTSAAFRPRR